MLRFIIFHHLALVVVVVVGAALVKEANWGRNYRTYYAVQRAVRKKPLEHPWGPILAPTVFFCDWH